MTLRSTPLNLFYEEDEPDRWFPLDRYPRRLARRIVRGRPQPGGQKRMFLNLRAGLDRLQVRYRVNNYRYARHNPSEVACIVGKPFVLDKMEWKNPILLGAATPHPLDDPALLDRLPIKRILVPGRWVEMMTKPAWGDAVATWPVGIDTDLWRPAVPEEKQYDVLLYDKVRWCHDDFEHSLISPIRTLLDRSGHSRMELRYGAYREADFHAAVGKCRTMIFLCEHETQGIAYQQALASGLPILAWDRGGYWQDPDFYPHRVQFQPVTSVPYWDNRCGMRFANAGEFPAAWDAFWEQYCGRCFRPREYVVENLGLERCADRYRAFARELEG